MIARFVTVSAAVLLLVGCSSRGPLAVAAFEQQQAPAAAAAPDSNASATSADSAAATPAPASSARTETVVDTGTGTWRIGPEDLLDVYVRNDRELNRVVPVRPDGRISLPLVNDVQAAGLTTDELRLQLMQQFKQFFENPEVSVSLREMHSFKVSVQGNVRMPGQYEVKSEQTVIDLLARAQGFNEFADRGSIRVLRKTGQSGKFDSLKFHYGDAREGRDGANFAVRPGDIIIVD
jgi:polysaccharide export outer membrane protein